MEILFFLVIATVCVLGVVAGNTFVAVFVSIPLAGMIWLAAQGDGPDTGKWIIGCIVALALIWSRVAAKHNDAKF
jgi:hypothetical protein